MLNDDPDLEKIEELGQKLSALRSARQMSTADVARFPGLDSSLITRYESGKATPGLKKLLALADALEVAADYLLGRVRDLKDVEIQVVLRKQSADVFIQRNSLSEDEKWLIRRLAESSEAPTTVGEWQAYAMVKMAQRLHTEHPTFR